MSIELDAHYAPDYADIKDKYPKDGAYVLHNIPKWRCPKLGKALAIDYMHENTLRKALDHFVSREYYHKSKVYVEMKVPKKCYRKTGKCEEDWGKLAVEHEPYVAYRKQDGSNWLCVSSFSPTALTKFRNTLSKNVRDSVDYVLIVGYDKGFPASVAANLKDMFRN